MVNIVQGTGGIYAPFADSAWANFMTTGLNYFPHFIIYSAIAEPSADNGYRIA